MDNEALRLENWVIGKNRIFGGTVYATRKDARIARATHRAEKSFNKEPKHGRKEANLSAP